MLNGVSSQREEKHRKAYKNSWDFLQKLQLTAGNKAEIKALVFVEMILNAHQTIKLEKKNSLGSINKLQNPFDVTVDNTPVLAL